MINLTLIPNVKKNIYIYIGCEEESTPWFIFLISKKLKVLEITVLKSFTLDLHSLAPPLYTP